MKLDTQLRDFHLGSIAEQTARFENMGFDGVWTFEAAHDPFIPLGIAAAATQKLTIGTNIAVAFGRSPFSTAVAAWDLHNGSEGRFRLGLGTQVRAHIERRFSMPFDHPAARIKDYILCLRAIWETFQTDARPEYQGEFYQFRLMNPFFNPGPSSFGEIPVYIAGVNPLMCRTAGEVADGFHVHPFHSAGYLRDVVRANLNDGARTRGKTVDDMDLYSPVFTVSGDTQEETDRAYLEVRQQISFYASTPNYRAVMEYHGYEDLADELKRMARVGEWDAMATKIPEALVEQVAVVASPADIPTALKQRCNGLLDRVSLYFPISANDDDEEWDRFVKDFAKPA